MNINVETADYINRVVNAIADGTITDADLGIADWCPECDDIIDPMYETYPHITTTTPGGKTVVIIGCERYWVIDPNMVGIVKPNWTDAAGNPSTHTTEYHAVGWDTITPCDTCNEPDPCGYHTP